MSISVSTTSGNTISVTVDGGTAVSFTEVSSSISITSPTTSSISITNKGPKGDTGATGATGTAGATGDTGATATAGDGIDVAGGEVSTDLKSNGGLVIESTELAVDLAASSITGTLATGDGGTGSTSTAYCALGSNISGTLPVANGGTGATSLTTDGVLFGNGTSAISAVDLSTNGNIIAGGSTPAAVTGANLAGSGLSATTGDGTLVLAVETLNQDTSGTAAIATTVTAADESSDTTCFPLFVTAATGNLGPKTGTNLAFNSSTGDLTVGGVLTAKTLHYINCSFYDDIGTTKHYLPLGGPPSEQASDGSAYTDFLTPCNLKVLSVILRLPTGVTGSGTITLDVQAADVGASPSFPSSVETEAVAVADTNDNDVVYFAFDNAALTVGQNLSISIQSDGDLSSAQYWHCTVVIEMDWSSRYTGSSVVKTS